MRRRIVIATTLSSLLCIALFAIPLAVAASFYFHSRARSELERIGFAVASASADNISSGSQVAARIRHSEDITVGLYDDSGRLISGVGDPAAAGIVAQALQGGEGGRTSGSVAGRLTVSVPVIEKDAVTGAVLASQPLARVQQQILLAWSVLAALAIASLAAAWLLARQQARRLADPIEHLSEAAQRLGQGRFDLAAASSGIAEIDSVNQSLQRTAQRLGLLLERERTLARDASHQIRTPLTGLRLLLERAAEDPARSAAQLHSALGTVERLESTVTDMLQLVRDQPSEHPLLDAAMVLVHVQQRWDSTFAATGRLLLVQADDELPDVRFPAGAARQIINILLDNAGIHGLGTVTVTIRDSLGSLAIDVSQQGPPLRTPVQQLFAEAPNAGSGIGLPMARRIAQSAAARLILGSADPPTFTLLIPPVAVTQPD
ncbi:MAG: HAMP domain-containing sensor histidine kinase [Jatrophihabitantaceae bacterium]